MPDPAQPIVSARALTRRYGEGETAVDALAGVTLDLPPGGFTAIMGDGDADDRIGAIAIDRGIRRSAQTRRVRIRRP